MEWWIIDIIKIINTLRQTALLNNILLSNRQKLLLHYHPISILTNDFGTNDESLDLEDMNKVKLKLILESNDDKGLLEVDQKLIEQLIGKKTSIREFTEQVLVLNQ